MKISSHLESRLLPTVLTLVFAFFMLWGGFENLLMAESPYNVGVAIVCFVVAAIAVMVARYWATHDPVYPPLKDDVE